MTEAFTARATNQTNLKELILHLSLHKNANDQYDHEQVQTFDTGIEHQLTTIFNLSDANNGMRKLPEEAKNIINQVHSTDAITADAVLSREKRLRTTSQRRS